MSVSRQPVDVLIAEDSEDDYLLAKDALKENCPHLRLRWVRDGEELMDTLLRRGSYAGTDGPAPRLILLDLHMPRKDGWEALKEIKEHPQLRLIPIVAFTTSNSAADVLYTYNLGINSFIRKPFGFQQFVDVMKTVDRYWFELVRLPDEK